MVTAAKHILSREQGFLALGIDATEWFRSRAELIKTYGETARLREPEINVKQIEAYREGSVGWAVDTVMFRRPGMSEITMRHNFILHQENGEWKVVHAHYSFPVHDEGSLAVEE
jgi:ketosteroid isomerase-like protein